MTSADLAEDTQKLYMKIYMFSDSVRMDNDPIQLKRNA